MPQNHNLIDFDGVWNIPYLNLQSLQCHVIDRVCFL